MGRAKGATEDEEGDVADTTEDSRDNGEEEEEGVGEDEWEEGVRLVRVVSAAGREEGRRRAASTDSSTTGTSWDVVRGEDAVTAEDEAEEDEGKVKLEEEEEEDVDKKGISFSFSFSLFFVPEYLPVLAFVMVNLTQSLMSKSNCFAHSRGESENERSISSVYSRRMASSTGPNCTCSARRGGDVGDEVGSEVAGVVEAEMLEGVVFDVVFEDENLDRDEEAEAVKRRKRARGLGNTTEEKSVAGGREEREIDSSVAIP